MSDQGRRERRRHARHFAAWCTQRGRAPALATRDDVDVFLESLSGDDPQRRPKARCALRAVLRQIDEELAARAAGLGNQTSKLTAYAGSPTGALISEFVAQGGERHAVRKSHLTRLFAWCAAVGIEPTELHIGDLFQFRHWLLSISAYPGEAMVVAKEFILLRRDAEGRRMLCEPDPVRRPLLIQLDPPLRPRFAPGGLRSRGETARRGDAPNSPAL